MNHDISPPSYSENLHEESKMFQAAQKCPDEFFRHTLDPWNDKSFEYVSSLPLSMIKFFVLETFRNTLQIPIVASIDAKTLNWLTELYMSTTFSKDGKAITFHKTDQINNLPFVVLEFDPPLERVTKLLYHIKLITETLQSLSDFYFAGYVHLLSRFESQKHLRNDGEYLFRISNSEPGTMIISTNKYHYYLNDFPFVFKTYLGENFKIYSLGLSDVKSYLHDHSELQTPVLTSVPLDFINSKYSSIRRAAYSESNQIYFQKITDHILCVSEAPFVKVLL